MWCRCVSDYNAYVEADAVADDDLADGELVVKHIQLARIVLYSTIYSILVFFNDRTVLPSENLRLLQLLVRPIGYLTSVVRENEEECGSHLR